MSIEEITNMQTAASIKFEVAKKIREILDQAESQFDNLEHDLDWQTELETIQELVFED